MDYTKIDLTIDGKINAALPKRVSMLKLVKHLCSRGVSPEQINECVPWRPTSMFRRVAGDMTSIEFIKHADVYSGGVRRFYCNEDELLKFNGRTYAVSNSWGNRTLEAIRAILATFPDKGVSCENRETSNLGVATTSLLDKRPTKADRRH